ncbi:hypothetical protein G6F35_018621 [Rhizopus arrhizus]|nr:hypothetical protein G6F35_018621 [Rhizopus arrhizus]
MFFRDSSAVDADSTGRGLRIFRDPCHAEHGGAGLHADVGGVADWRAHGVAAGHGGAGVGAVPGVVVPE